MTINKKENNGETVLSIEGKITTLTSPQFQEELMTALAETDSITLDFSEVDYMSSAGLRVLFAGQETADAGGKKVILCNVSDEIKEILDMTGFSGFMEIV